jgi:DNA integrity scanning protein DisA with diadenylate cyclase activity
VIARSTRLEDYTTDPSRRGLLLRAEIRRTPARSSSPTPLHDGAAIIENNRIEAAGCLLPLSEARPRQVARQPPPGGHRHHEVSDAVAVIVSEETSTISVAEAAASTADSTPRPRAQPEALPRSSQGPFFRPGGRMKRALLENFG